MTKSQLVKAVSIRSKITTGRARYAIDLLWRMIADALARGESVELRGFGDFVVKDYDEYTSRDPRNGTPVEIKKKVLPRFSPSPEMLDLLNSVHHSGA